MLPHASALANIHMRHHGREVERRDAGDDTERLADGVHVDTAGRLLGVAALQQMGMPQANSMFSSPRHLAQRVAEHLAVLEGEERSDLPAAGVDRLAQMEHHLGPLRQRSSPPRRERRSGGGDGGVDLLDRSQVDFGLLLADGGVPHRAGATRCADDDFTVDPMTGCASCSSSDEVLREAALEVATVTLLTDVLRVVLDDHLAATDDGVDLAVDDHAFVGRVVHVHVMGVVDADLRFRVRVVHDDIGVAAGSNTPFCG